MDSDRVIALYGLEGKVALITGGAMGLGKAIAELFVAAGATVVIADIDDASLADTVDEARGRGVTLHGFHADVADEAAVDALVQQVEASHSGIDVLVNNAGVYPRKPSSTSPPFYPPLLEFPLEWWEKQLAHNLRSAFLMTKAVGRSMAERGRGGAVVNIASLAAVHPGLQGNAAYAASKGGMVAFTRSSAIELAPNQIRVNALCPHGFDVEGQVLVGAIAARAAQRLPLGRTGTDPITASTLFLASEAASHMTGQTLIVDGGFLVA
jgi:NAD(P)-dependent dehydrogenase (short-subunit alcohol dehydrogenase family)